MMGLEIINELRKKKNLTSEQLSSKSGVPLGTLNKILNGTTKDPKLETLKALARVLECSLDDFDDIPKEEKKSNQIETLAVHFEGEEFTEADMNDIENFIKYVKSKKK
jgi:transcriptional regulator with XRE-family HTH domain